MNVKAILTTLLFSMSSLALAVDSVRTIPPAFHGKWSEKIEDCTQDGEGNLTVSRKALAGYENYGTVKKVTVNGPLDIVVFAKNAGEGETWESTRRFRLSPDKKLLMDITYKEPNVLLRCP